jgi:hypothetical protein
MQLFAAGPVDQLSTTMTEGGGAYILTADSLGVPQLFQKAAGATGWTLEAIPALARVPRNPELLTTSSGPFLYGLDRTQLTELRLSFSDTWAWAQVSDVQVTGKPCALFIPETTILIARNAASAKGILALQGRSGKWNHIAALEALWKGFDTTEDPVCGRGGVSGRDLVVVVVGSDGKLHMTASHDNGATWALETLDAPNKQSAQVSGGVAGRVAFAVNYNSSDVLAITRRGELVHWSVADGQTAWKFETIQLVGVPVLEGSPAAVWHENRLIAVARTIDRKIAVFSKTSLASPWQFTLLESPQPEVIADDLHLIAQGGSLSALARSQSGKLIELSNNADANTWASAIFQPEPPPPPLPAPAPAPPSVVAQPRPVKICIDMPVPAAALPPRQSPPGALLVGSDGSVIATRPQELAGITEKMWDIGQTIRVKMAPASDYVQSNIRRYAEQWMQYANIRIQFVDPSQYAEIRISFDTKGGSWSLIGRDALGTPAFAPTMNFGWFNDQTEPDEFSRTVLHEFGHALGLIHEHQSPVSGIQWDKQKVYDYFWDNDHWDRNKVDAQVFQKYSVASTNYSQYDPTSIMHYSIPAELTLNGVGTPWNTVLSNIDKQYIARWYPRTPTPQNSIGLLRTGDDCDEIDFSVEYGAGSPSSIQFNLAEARGIWWKAIEIPVGASGYKMLEIQDGSSASYTPLVSDLGISRPIRFWKAKFLGIHTRLGYTWDVLRALPGGTRVSLYWKRDSCH